MTHIILTPLYPPKRFGGIEKIVQRLAEGLTLVGDEVAIYTFDPRPDATTCEIHSERMRVHRIACATTSGSVAEILASQTQISEAVSYFSGRSGCPAVIHAHDWFVGPAALFLRQCLGLPLLTIFHSDKRTEYGNRIVGDRRKIHELQRSLAEGSDGILCYSRFMQNCISSSMNIPPEQIDTFTCGIDENVTRRSGPPTATLLYLGRLAAEKDVGTLVRAFGRVSQKRPDCRLRIIGDGAERPHLEQLVEALNLKDKVHFSPFTSDPQRVEDELLYADALILPSVFEPFGLVVLEAISRLVPVIVPTSGGPSEIVRGGVTGWCFTVGDDEELARKIIECLEDPARACAYASRALEDTSRRFRWESGVAKLRGMCRALLAKRMEA